jgi:hypothetical protein
VNVIKISRAILGITISWDMLQRKVQMSHKFAAFDWSKRDETIGSFMENIFIMGFVSQETVHIS